MGIPAYYKSIITRNPDIITTKEIIFNNLFLDLNCAIHPCCRRITKEGYNSNKKDSFENKMISEILNYISLLVKTVNPENLLYIAEKKLKDNTDELLLKNDKDNHFKIFSRILLPQFVRQNDKEDNKRLKNLYTYFKRVNLDYGLRPYPNNKNKYYRKYHKKANIENVEVKYIPDK